MPIPIVVSIDRATQTFLTGLVHNATFALAQELRTMSDTTDRLTAEVAGIKGAAASAVVLLDGLAAFIRDNSADPAALNALADDLAASKNALADAIARDPVPEPVPPPAA